MRLAGKPTQNSRAESISARALVLVSGGYSPSVTGACLSHLDCYPVADSNTGHYLHAA